MSAEMPSTKESSGSSSSSMVNLNVGGVRFTTYLATLRAHPHSVLGQMFSKPIAAPRDARDGSYFIDRNGSVFELILDYLRTGTLAVPRDPVQYTVLRREIGFYGLPIYSQLPQSQTAFCHTVPSRVRHARIVIDEIEKSIEWDEGAVPLDLKGKSVSEIVSFFSARGYKIASEYVSRGTKGLTSIWMSKEEPYPGVDIPIVVRDAPRPTGQATASSPLSSYAARGALSQTATAPPTSPESTKANLLSDPSSPLAPAAATAETPLATIPQTESVHSPDRSE